MIKFYRAIKIAFQYMYRNFGLSFASVVVMTLSFFIVSIVGIAFYGTSQLIRYVDSKPALIIFLRGDLNEEQADEFVRIVNSTGLVRDLSLKDIKYTKQDFENRYPDPDLQEALSSEDLKSFLPIVTFIYSDSQENLRKLITVLENNENFMQNIVDRKNIDRVGWYSFDQDQASFIRESNRIISLAGGTITVFLFLISSILIFITIKLAINYHKRELEIMSLVGADGWFIRLPFIVAGMVYGVLGAFFSTSIIFLFKNFVMQSSQNLVPRLSQFFGEVPWPSLDLELIIYLYLFTTFTGALVGALSSFFAILKYVKN